MSYWNSGRALDSRSTFGFSVSLTPAATAAASAVEQAFTVPAASLPAGVKLKVGDLVYVTGPGSGNNVAVGGARINSSGQLVIQFVNPTAGALTHAAGTFNVLVARL
jgi:hypothetical protein